MSSSAVINSGKFSGQKSNFSQTCAMLSQYVKNNGQFGDLLSSNFQPQGCSRVTTTQDFLPMIEKSGESVFGPESEKNVEAERAQMTILYQGQVMVFDDFPADKAQQIMSLGRDAGATHPQTSESGTNLVGSSCTNRVMKQSNQMLPQPQGLVNDADMPIVRKASLARFFEKRKHRITATAPYQFTNSIAPTLDSSSNSWLSLAPQSPLQMEPQY